MKSDIHPKYFENARIVCVCGNTFTTGATLEEIRIEVCNKCHPFFTGEMKFVDTLGRVEKFQKSQEAAKVKKQETVKKLEEKQEKVRPSSLKEMFDLVKKQASS